MNLRREVWGIRGLRPKEVSACDEKLTNPLPSPHQDGTGQTEPLNELGFHQITIGTVLRDQFVVAATLDDAALIENQNAIGMAHG